MSARVEDYALIGDLQTAALVSRQGSIDWLCLPRFYSGACFAALLGSEENGRWLIEPNAPAENVSRRYRGETLVLETEWRTKDGVARVIETMRVFGAVPADMKMAPETLFDNKFVQKALAK